jgi:hypothetical protein
MLYVYFENITFQDLAQELVSVFQGLGYQAQLTSSISRQSYLDLYIIFGMNDFNSDVVPPNYIVYQLEQTTGQDESNWFSERYVNHMKKALAVWDYSLVNYQNLKKLGIKNLEYVPIQYLRTCDQITQKSPTQKDIDIFFFGSMNERRQAIIDELQKRGLTVVVKTNVWKVERDELISRSKFVLNIHYYQTSILETTRLSYLLSNNCHVISESSKDQLLDRWHQKYLLSSSYEGLVDLCCQAVQAYQSLNLSLPATEAPPSTLSQFLSDLTFKSFAEYKTQTWQSKLPILKLESAYGYLLSKMTVEQQLTHEATLPQIEAPVIDSSDIFEAECEITENQELTLKLPKLIYEDLPCVSIVTVTYNRKSVFPMAIRNYELFEYPRDKIEWIIVDDSDNGESLSDILPKSNRIKYYKLDTTGRLSIGHKRNFGVENASHEYIFFMDDDDYYYPLSIYARMAVLLKYPQYDLVGVTDLDIYDVVNEFSAKIKGSHVSEASMALKKSFWKECQFPVKFNSLGEGYPFTKGRRNRIVKMPSCFNLIALTHWTNYTQANRSYQKFQSVEKKSNILRILDLQTRLFIFDLFDRIKKSHTPTQSASQCAP